MNTGWFSIIRLVCVISVILSPSLFCQNAPQSKPANQPAIRPWSEVQTTNETSIVYINFDGMYDNGREDKWTGTGFIVSQEGHFLTCSHVLPPIKDYKSYGAQVIIGATQGTSYTIGVDDFIDRLEDLDLVLFKLPQSPTPWHSIQAANKKKVVLFTPVMGLGFPIDQGLTPAKGEITNLRAKKASCWLTSAPLNKGMSGGPVFDQTGAVIAVVASGHPEAQLINEVIPISYAWHFFEEIDSPLITKANQALQQTAELVANAAQSAENTQKILSSKQLASNDSAKAVELYEKAARTKSDWVAAYSQFVELSKNTRRNESTSEREELIRGLRGKAQEYQETTEALAHLASSAPTPNQTPDSITLPPKMLVESTWDALVDIAKLSRVPTPQEVEKRMPNSILPKDPKDKQILLNRLVSDWKDLKQIAFLPPVQVWEQKESKEIGSLNRTIFAADFGTQYDQYGRPMPYITMSIDVDQTGKLRGWHVPAR